MLAYHSDCSLGFFCAEASIVVSWPNSDLAAYISLGLSVVWLAMLGGVLYGYRWRGLWILIWRSVRAVLSVLVLHARSRLLAKHQGLPLTARRAGFG